MNAVEVAPRAQAGQVPVRVVAAVGAKPQVMRSDVVAAAAGALAAVAIAFVDVCILDLSARRAPRVDEELTGESQKGRVAQRGAAMAKINCLPVPKIASCAGSH